jgi:pilus assembly protein CpaC
MGRSARTGQDHRRVLRAACIYAVVLIAVGCGAGGPHARAAGPAGDPAQADPAPEEKTPSPAEGAKRGRLIEVPAAASGEAARPAGRYGDTKLIVNYEGPLQVPAGQSIMLHLSAPAERVSIADPEVAEVVLISPTEVVINGKGRKATHTTTNIYGASASEETVGEAQTTVIVWDHAGHSDMRTLYVNKSRAEQIVMEVTVADVNRSALENYGFDFQFFQGKVLVAGTQGKLFSFDKIEPVFGAGATSISQELHANAERLSYLVQDLNNDFMAFIEVLQRENLAKLLARPVLVARSGEAAHFRVGGEVPIVYATQNIAQVTFKEFGTLLDMTPTLTDDGQIDLRIATEVSEPSTAFQAAVIQGFVVPSFVSRRAETRVRLRQEESLLIGGLYRENTTEQEDKTPYLGDVPYLGALFRRTHFERQRNELLILVRPRLARAGEVIAPHLPTGRPPLTRPEVRTLQKNPYPVTRPRLMQPPGPEKPPPGPHVPWVEEEGGAGAPQTAPGGERKRR